MISDSHFVQRPPGAGNEHSQCSARLSERLRTSTFNENSDIRLFQQEIQSLYQCFSSKKNYRENDQFRYHRGLLRFRYICLNAPLWDEVTGETRPVTTSTGVSPRSIYSGL